MDVGLGERVRQLPEADTEGDDDHGDEDVLGHDEQGDDDHDDEADTHADRGRQVATGSALTFGLAWSLVGLDPLGGSRTGLLRPQGAPPLCS